MQTTSSCYKGTYKMTVRGVLWHSTGANNPQLKRYVQPSDNAKDRAQMLKLLGTNTNGNDWNHIYRGAGLNAWIGKLADGTVTTVQTMPWNYAPWGCGVAYNGGPSCNNGWIQFEICEDGLTNKAYFDKVYQEAVELTAYLCTLYGLDPMGTTKHSSGKSCPVILCHWDSYTLGLGCGHVDVYHWFNRHGKCMGKSMDDVRRDVKKCMEVEDLTKEETLALIQQEIGKIKIPEIPKIPDAAGIARNVYADIVKNRQEQPAAEWAKESLQIAMARGLTDGSRPQDYLTRQEAAVLALRILGVGKDPAEWSEEARKWALDSGLIQGDGTSDAWAELITKEQMAAVLYRMEQMNRGEF